MFYRLFVLCKGIFFVILVKVPFFVIFTTNSLYFLLLLISQSILFHLTLPHKQMGVANVKIHTGLWHIFPFTLKWSSTIILFLLDSIKLRFCSFKKSGCICWYMGTWQLNGQNTTYLAICRILRFFYEQNYRRHKQYM